MLPPSPFNHRGGAPMMRQAEHWTSSYVGFSLRSKVWIICHLQGGTEVPNIYVLLTLTALASCGCCNNYHKLVAIKHQTFALSQFWRADVWNQDISKAATEPARSGCCKPQLERPCAPTKAPTWYSKDPTCCSWDPMKANKHLNGFILKDHLLKTWHWQGHTPCGASMGESFPCPHSLTWGLEALLLQSLPPHFCLCQNSLCFSFIKTLQIYLFCCGGWALFNQLRSELPDHLCW